MKLLDTESPAGRAIELVGDLLSQGRMSKAEARVIEDLVCHPDLPQALRSKVVVPGHPPGTDTVRLPPVFDGRRSAFSAIPVSHETREIDPSTGRDLGCAD